MRNYIKNINWQKQIFAVGMVILSFAYLGPFGTFYDLSFLSRLLFWAIIILGCGVVFWSLIFLSSRIKKVGSLSVYSYFLITVFVTSFPSFFIIYYINIYMRNITFQTERFPKIWLSVFLIGSFVATISYFSQIWKTPKLTKTILDKEGAENIEFDKNISQFLQKLPKEIGTDLISLSSHDHYIDVQTTKGTAMIYMNLSDAIKELKNYPGVRIHRSHWVVESEIVEIKKTGRALSVLLSNGRELPVSKTYEKTIELT